MRLFILHPDIHYHARDLARHVDANYSAIWKELQNLEQVGFLQREMIMNRKAYRLNGAFPILPELRSIILKTIGAGDQIRQYLSDLGVIKAAFIYGSFAEGTPDLHSDLDLMIIGDIDLSALSSSIAMMEEELARPVNYITYSWEEWKTKVERKEAVILNVLKGDKIMLMGSIDEL